MAGLDQPFELLNACHDRVHRTLALLIRLDEHLKLHGADRAAKEAAADVQRYFDIAAPLHHEDEELHVLPVLRAIGKYSIADSLLADHKQMSTEWVAIRADLQEIQECVELKAEELKFSGKRWLAFAALYSKHIQLEETSAYPAAMGHISSDKLKAMTLDMATRRGASPSIPKPPMVR